MGSTRQSNQLAFVAKGKAGESALSSSTAYLTIFAHLKITQTQPPSNASNFDRHSYSDTHW